VEVFGLLVKKVVDIMKLKLILVQLISVLDCARLCPESLETKRDNNLDGLNI